MKKIFNFKIFFILALAISILIVIRIDIFKITYYSINKIDHLFSNELKQSVKNVIHEAIKQNSYYSQSIVVKLMANTAKKTFSNKNILEKRNLLLNDYILDSEQITYFEKPELVESIKFNTYPDKNSKIMGVNFYKINNYSIIEYSKYHSNNKKKLLIYNQGHGGNPYNHDYFIKLKEHYKQKGFDIMSLSMSNIGYNEEPVNFPLIDLEIVKKSPYPHGLHSMYHKFHDEKYPNKKPLSLMLSGNYYLIKKFLSDSAYEEIYMIGISGGGLYTTFLSSIITEIETSYSFSGTAPLIFQFWRSKGCWEHHASKVYTKVDFWDLYFLSTIDKFNNQNRKHFQVYNKSDPLIFLSMAQATADNIGITNFKVELANIDKHVIDIDFLFSQF